MRRKIIDHQDLLTIGSAEKTEQVGVAGIDHLHAAVVKIQSATLVACVQIGLERSFRLRRKGSRPNNERSATFRLCVVSELHTDPR